MLMKINQLSRKVSILMVTGCQQRVLQLIELKIDVDLITSI